MQHEAIAASQSALVTALQAENAQLKEEIRMKVHQVSVLEAQFETMATKQLDATRLMESDAVQAVIKISEANVNRAHATLLLTVCSR